MSMGNEDVGRWGVRATAMPDGSDEGAAAVRLQAHVDALTCNFVKLVDVVRSSRGAGCTLSLMGMLAGPVVMGVLVDVLGQHKFADGSRVADAVELEDAWSKVVECMHKCMGLLWEGAADGVNLPMVVAVLGPPRADRVVVITSLAALLACGVAEAVDFDESPSLADPINTAAT